MNLFKIVILSFFWVLSWENICLGQSIQSNFIKISLSELSNDSVAFPNFLRSEVFLKDTLFKGSEFTTDSAKIYQFILQEQNHYDPDYKETKLLGYYAVVESQGQIFIIFDTNNDRNFANEKFFKFSDKITTYYQIENLDFQLGDVVTKQTISLKLVRPTQVISNRFRKTNPKIICAAVPLTRKGTLILPEGDAYKISMFNDFYVGYTNSNTRLTVSKNPPHSHMVTYKTEDTIYLDKGRYVFKSVSIDGSEIILERLDSLKKSFGVEVGFYAFDMVAQPIGYHFRYVFGQSQKYTLLDFWGTWCIPCVKTTDDLKKIYEELNGNFFEIIGIAFDRDKTTVKKYLKRHDIQWLSIFDDSQNKLGLSKKFKVADFPTFILLDKSGKIVFRDVGVDAIPRLKQFLKENVK